MLLLSLRSSSDLCLPIQPFNPTPHFVLHIENSHKYSTDLMRQYHCNKLIERKQLFHLGIAHNRLIQMGIYFWMHSHFHNYHI
jgi:hypothetical protein